MLKEALNQTRQAIPDASLIYVDTHAILLELFQHPTSHGMVRFKPMPQKSHITHIIPCVSSIYGIDN